MTSIVRFQHKERAYDAWRSANPTGFVFNHFEGKNENFNVVHRATCAHLSRAKDDGARTVIEKICSVSRAELEVVASMLRGGASGWKRCGACMS